jgi:Undecaprenyl-phosphate glucose phosphotransferase
MTTNRIPVVNIGDSYSDSGATPLAGILADRITFSKPIISGLIALSDALLIFITGLCLYLIYPGWGEGETSNYLGALLLNICFTLPVFYFAHLYEINPRPQHKALIRKLILVYTITFLVLIAFTFVLKNADNYSRIWAMSWYLASLILITHERFLFHLLITSLSSKGRLTRNIAIIGAQEQGARLVKALGTNKDPWLRIAGIFDERSDRVPDNIHEYPISGNIDALIKDVRERRIDDVLVALPWVAERRTLEIIEKLKVLPVPVKLCPDMIGFNFPYHSFSYYGGIPVLDINDKPIDGWDSVLKAMEDRILALLFLLPALPLMLVIAILIKLDSPGPVFFRQMRYGFNNQTINVLKFRSLRVEEQDETAESLVTKDDPRVTRVGAFLRRTSLDELPQMLNVLKGDMSMVGPRPHAMRAKAGGRYYESVVAQYAARHNVKPGITGWAQVNGWRGETDTEDKILKRVEFDLHYIENWSILFDLRIIMKTIPSLLRRENAY